ncbi:hypothetical protein JCM8097_008005 [Rhodosporidiobolus ruineniae]
MSSTSSLPLDAAPKASPSFPRPPPVLIASLASLPTELKARIAAHISDRSSCISLLEAPPVAEQDNMGANSPPATCLHDNLTALSRVNREFSEICAAINWKHVDLTKQPLEVTAEHLRHFLPRRARLVQALSAGPDPKQDKQHGVFHRTLGTVSSVERFARTSGAGLDFVDRQRRCTDLLAAAAVSWCFNLQSLTVTQTPGSTFDELFATVADGWVPRLSALKVVLTSASPISQAWVGSVCAAITACPSLRSMKLAHYAARPADCCLLNLVAQCPPTLRALSLRGPVADAFIATLPAAPIASLFLHRSGSSSSTLSTLRAYTTSVGVHLTYLSFGLRLPPEPLDAYVSPLTLPSLHTLVLAGDQDSRFLNLFADSPLEVFELSSSVSNLSFPLEQLKAFLTEHVQTAKTVRLAESVYKRYDGAAIDAFECWCSGNGLALEVVQADES